MGWLIGYTQDKKTFVQEMLGKGSETCVFNEHSLKGNRLWVRASNPALGTSFILLFLLRKDRGYGWGYKGIDETVGPYYFDCPLGMLDRCTAPYNDTATAWRAKVREAHATRPTRRTWAPGMRVSIPHAPGYGVMTLLEPLGRRGWRTTGYIRIPARVMTTAVLVPPS